MGRFLIIIGAIAIAGLIVVVRPTYQQGTTASGATVRSTALPVAQPRPAGGVSGPHPADDAEHLSNARDYIRAGNYGLALAELDQAVAARVPEAESLRRAIRADATAQIANMPKLELQRGWGCSRTSTGFMTFEGQAKNISGGPLRRIEAVVSYYTRDGTFLTSSTALIEYNPVLDGQISPFKVITRYNPEIATCNVEFKEFNGGSVHHTRL